MLLLFYFCLSRLSFILKTFLLSVECSVLKGTSVPHSVLLGLRDHHGGGEGKIVTEVAADCCWKGCFTSELTAAVTACTRSACHGASRNPSTERGGAREEPRLAEELLEIGDCSGRESFPSPLGI